jgi:Rod binding domain-containing protein
MPDLSSLFPGIGQTDPMQLASILGGIAIPSFGVQALNMLNDRVNQEKQYASMLGQAMAQARATQGKGLMDAMLETNKQSVTAQGNALDAQIARERMEAYPWAWAPRTPEEALWWLQQKKKYQPAGSGNSLLQLLGLIISAAKVPQVEGSYNILTGQQTEPQQNPYMNTLDYILRQQMGLPVPQKSSAVNTGNSEVDSLFSGKRF